MSSQKVAVVTGANKGLGFSIVKKLSKDYEGKVYLTSRDEHKGTIACEEIRKLNPGDSSRYNKEMSMQKKDPNPSFHQLDVTDTESINNFVKHIQANNEKVEILVNNAGILFLEDSPEPMIIQAEQTISVNFTGLVDFTEEILPLLIDGGKIVNITCSSAHLSRISGTLRYYFNSKSLTLSELKGLVNKYVAYMKQTQDVTKLKYEQMDLKFGDSAYVVSKVAVNAYTFILHRILSSRGISVNCVHPGYVMTDMTRGDGSVTPEDAAALPVKLALTPWESGLYVWHNGTEVPWDDKDPRVYIDGRKAERNNEYSDDYYDWFTDSEYSTDKWADLANIFDWPPIPSASAPATGSATAPTLHIGKTEINNANTDQVSVSKPRSVYERIFKRMM